MGIVETVAEDALTAAVPEVGLPLKILGWFKGLPSAVLALVKAHPMACLLAVSLLANFAQWHFAGVDKRQAQRQHASDLAAFTQEQAAFKSVLNSYHVVRAALAGQNASIEHAQAQGDAAHRAQQAALAAGTSNASHRAAQAQAQTNDAATQASVPGCATPSDVMNQKGDL